MKYDSAVIGSGVSGLTAALLLAQNGHRVALIEKNTKLAPLIRRFKRGNFWCDTGFHYSCGFDQSGCLTVVFRYLGIMDKINPIPVNQDAYDILISKNPEKKIILPIGFDRVRESLCEHFPKSKNAIFQYFERLNLIQRSTPFLNFDINLDEFSPNKFGGEESLANFLRNADAEECLIKTLGDYGLYLYGADAEESSLVMHSLIIGSFYKSAHTFLNGGDELIDAYEAKLKDCNVDVFCGAGAAKILADDKKKLIGIVLSNGEFIETKTAICTIHPQLLQTMFAKEIAENPNFAYIKYLQNTYPVFVVYLACDIDFQNETGSNYYFINTDKKSSDLLVLLGCNKYKNSENKKTLCVFYPWVKNLPQQVRRSDDEKSYLDFKGKIIEIIMYKLFENFPHLKGKCRIIDTATPWTLEKWTGTAEGSVYGIKNSIHQKKITHKTPIKGFYLAGQSINTPGIMGSIISSFIAVSNIFRFDNMWKDIQKYR